jgi:hypothetical protein
MAVRLLLSSGGERVIENADGARLDGELFLVTRWSDSDGVCAGSTCEFRSGHNSFALLNSSLAERLRSINATDWTESLCILTVRLRRYAAL